MAAQPVVSRGRAKRGKRRRRRRSEDGGWRMEDRRGWHGCRFMEWFRRCRSLAG
jgi:hypothetical protein